jgi:hypothetical protein
VTGLLLALPLALSFRNGKADQTPSPVVLAAAAVSSGLPAEPGDVCLQRFLQPLGDMAGIALSSPAPAPAPQSLTPATPAWDAPLEALLSALDDRCSTQVETVIATVADPIDSGLGYQFDTSLQALRLGVESALAGNSTRFYRDRSWLPWDDRNAAPDKAIASAECRRLLPGVVLFRGSNTHERKLLALLLVGETPTTGVHVTAMLRALSISARFAGTGAACPERAAQEPTRIVGPTFSGSAQSLRTAIARFNELEPERARDVRIVTGSATGSALKSVLRHQPAAGDVKGKRIEFASTTAAESEVQCAYLRYLHHFIGYGQRRAPGADPRLPGVALLHESGTEFGAQGTSRDCPFAATIDISFPAHISLLRDAYEDLDKAGGNGDGEAIARRTSLAVSLREKRRPLTLEAEPSPKTTFAQDIALTNVLGAISRGAVRHVGVQATDVADAIFLSRRIRDVAPDVRLAFFASDVLLLHPAFRRDLAGSLVVTPYPFLGSTDLASVFSNAHGPRVHRGFENSASIGTFNAVLAVRDASSAELVEYGFTAEKPLLPIWISAIGSSGLVPISISPNHDRDRIVYSGERHFEPKLGAAEAASPPKRAVRPQAGGARGNAMPLWRNMRSAELGLEADVRIPRLWHFVYLLLALLFVVDRLLQRRALRTLSPVIIPERLGRREDRDADLAIIRTKWRLYAAVRTYALAFGLGYMGLIYCLAFFTYWPSGAPPLLGTLVVGLVVVLAIACAAWDAREFAGDYTALGRCVRGRAPTVWLSELVLRRRDRRARRGSSRAPLSNEQSIDSALEEDPVVPDRWDRVSLPFGFARPEGRIPAARTSFSQLRLLANVALAVALLFTIGQFWVIIADAKLLLSEAHPIPRTTLLALRSLPILNTVSPAAPTLWCVLGVYLWSVGRMARLRLVSGLSRISPDDGVADLVSTPIRVILHPEHGYGKKADESFTRVERRALNAIVRPITGPNYFLALLAIVIVPVVLFTLKPLSTLERPATTWLLIGGLALSVVLIGNTLIQLIQHWVALELLLKRVFQHRLGRAFDRVARFVRDSIHQQLSRAPHDLLRLSGCAVRFDELVRSGRALGDGGLAEQERTELERRSASMQLLRAEALSASTLRDVGEAAALEAELGRSVLEAARDTMRLLLRAWAGTLPRRERPAEELPAQRSDTVPADELGDDALSAEAHRYSALEFRWLRDAEAFAATVVALLIQRHVRQFQYFMYTLTGCGLLLLFAISSYPFEPHRLLLTVIWVIVGTVVVVGLFVYVELDRNALVSRLAGTAPGHMTLDGALALRIVAWVIVPLLGVAAAQYPDLANALFRAVEPFARALR